METKITGAIAPLGVWIILVSLSAALAQGKSISSHKQAYLVDSRTDESLAEEGEDFLALVVVPGAPWLRLHFSEYNLGERSYITLTSEDGFQHRLDAKNLTYLQGSSAYSKGQGVVVELHVAPGERGIFFRIEEVTVGEYLSVTPTSENVRADTRPCKICGSGERCENGCGPDDWKNAVIGFVLDPIFEEACNRHDRCYCHGDATYCKNRDQCDDDFLDDMIDACFDTFCVEIGGVTICEPIHLGSCVLAAEAAYAAVYLSGGKYRCCPETQTCYDYYGLGGEWACPAEKPPIVYVDGSFTGCPQHGTEGKPVSRVDRGVTKVASGGTVIIAAGSYPETPFIRKNLTLEASGGTVVISDKLSLTTSGRIRIYSGELKIH